MNFSSAYKLQGVDYSLSFIEKDLVSATRFIEKIKTERLKATRSSEFCLVKENERWNKFLISTPSSLTVLSLFFKEGSDIKSSLEEFKSTVEPPETIIKTILASNSLGFKTLSKPVF